MLVTQAKGKKKKSTNILDNYIRAIGFLNHALTQIYFANQLSSPRSLFFSLFIIKHKKETN